MASSVHDNLLVSYEVQCVIMLRTELRVAGQRTKVTNIIFEGVHGYDFENDAFGNIICDLESVSVEHLLAQYGDEISESYRQAGAPGPWAADLASLPSTFVGKV